MKEKIGYLYKTRYRGFNLIHMTEYLNEEERIRVSRESVRQILLELGFYERKKRYPKHRQRREPCAREGQMIQFDTSDHDWLEGRGFQILPDEYRLSFFKAKVEVHKYLDGSFQLFYQGRKSKHKPISQEKFRQRENDLSTAAY